MKYWRYFMLALTLVLLTYSSCEPVDEEPDPSDPVTKFLGDWRVNETCRRMNYSVEILPDPGNSAQVLIYNFGNPGPGYDPAIGVVTSNSVTVFTQTIGTDWTVSGKGDYLSDGTIDWDYSLVIGPNSLDCSAVFSRR